MRARLLRLRANRGLGDVIRTLVVGALMLFLVVIMAVREGALLPALALGVGVALPTRLRDWMLADLERSQTVQRILGFGLILLAAVGGLFRDALLAAVPEATAVGLLAGVVGFYLSYFVVLYSDPDVISVRSE